MEGNTFLDYKKYRYVGPLTFFYEWGSGIPDHITAPAKVLSIIPIKQDDQNNSNPAAIKKLVAMISDKHCREVPYMRA
ncbi:hypothetical protein LAV72_07135 [Lysinibacillus xylanilyticus]|uniref:hypothetical protein n=1 Tax=Lysinibacillus xylanilyticus TaxID=582475 RepID=UPI002B24C2DB|nr:hypothetical protein [Lysinibacillus xylanilyticus]MEB2299396.1 hypothetical protein [Lysinibacillus xylanilyticus]